MKDKLRLALADLMEKNKEIEICYKKYENMMKEFDQVPTEGLYDEMIKTRNDYMELYVELDMLERTVRSLSGL